MVHHRGRQVFRLRPSSRHGWETGQVNDERDGDRMPCGSCIGVGKQRRATCAVDPQGKGHTLVHPYECRTCGGEGWVAVHRGSP